MKVFKKNIWSLFYTIVLLGIAIFAFYLNDLKETEFEYYVKQQEHLTRLTASSVNSILSQHELFLDVLGDRLTKDERYRDHDSRKEVLTSLQKSNPAISSIALFERNGDIIITTDDLDDLKPHPNLLEKEETRNSFSYTLKKDVMVLGRTYYLDTVKRFIIPLRKAIKDENGKVLFVISAVMDAEKSIHLLKDTNYRTVLFRTFDNHFQLSNRYDESIYDIQVPQEEIEAHDQTLLKKYGLSIDEIKERQKVVSFSLRPIHDDYDVIATMQYIKRYELQVVAHTDKEIVEKIVLQKSIPPLLLFTFIIAALYWLSKSIFDDEVKQQKTLYDQAMHDHLTGLHNRLFLSKALDEKTSGPFTLLFIDLDHFKKLNDNFGVNVGDMVLKEVAKRLVSFRQKHDLLIRYSSDEFLLITKVLDKVKIKTLAANILERLSTPYHLDQYRFSFGASIGISQYPSDADEISKIIGYADLAMNEAKKKKNSFFIFEDSIKERYLKNFRIENELKTAINNDELHMVYQPQIDIDGAFLGVEALVRWENDSLGPVPPGEFIEIAESTGHMSRIGQYVMETSLEEVYRIQSLTGLAFRLSINISIKQFMGSGFFEGLFRCIENVGIDRDLITLEVTENVFIEDIGYILNLLKKIKGQGIKISLDDFGTGYSSLSVLKRLPIDELKIDKSFVDDITFDDEAKKMVQSIISIGKKFDLEIVGEGVETLEQMQVMAQYGCRVFQGYHYSRPLREDDLLAYIKAMDI